METCISFQKYQTVLNKSFFKKLGKVENVVGLTIESSGPDAKLGDMCKIYTDSEKEHGILAEVVGFKDKRTLLMPYEDTEGIGLGCIVENMNYPLSVSVGECLLGKTLDGLGRCIDGFVPEPTTVKRYPLEAQPPDPMSRTIISEVLPLGVKAVDGLITVGKGQRIGIFAGSGVGKSTLMGMFARNT
ncbi:MAG: flagellum-specific ATP synthase FliI, partial [Lachnospiraceae bacterium]|nr:flagellum-specific ATP synthase FliI [Lachnospiraceae bacterium]